VPDSIASKDSPFDVDATVPCERVVCKASHSLDVTSHFPASTFLVGGRPSTVVPRPQMGSGKPGDAATIEGGLSNVPESRVAGSCVGKGAVRYAW
jgi:hypothetical protein